MKNKIKIAFGITCTIITILFIWIYSEIYPCPPDILSKTINSKTDNVSFYWKDDKGEIFNNIGNIKKQIEKQNLDLIFAANGGMFDKSFRPIGLYIENGKTLHPINNIILKRNKNRNIPNFYLQPNGVFYITSDDIAGICQTSNLPKDINIKYATQSGPMLVFNRHINNKFKKDSKNYNIRNGVGILPNKDLIFAISINKVTFYDFAKFFKDKGCVNALFLDGYVSKTYLPEKNWKQTDGELGVIVAVTKSK